MIVSLTEVNGTEFDLDASLIAAVGEAPTEQQSKGANCIIVLNRAIGRNIYSFLVRESHPEARALWLAACGKKDSPN